MKSTGRRPWVMKSPLCWLQTSTYSSIDGPLSCFHVMAIVNSAVVNIGVHVSFWIVVFSGYMSSSGTAGTYGSSIFSFLRSLHGVLHNGCINFCSHQQCKSPFSPHSLHCILFIDLFNDGCSDQYKVIYSLFVVLICIFLIVMLSIFPCTFWPSVYLLWRNVCLDLLPIFWLGCLFIFFFFYIELCELFPCFGD